MFCVYPLTKSIFPLGSRINNLYGLRASNSKDYFQADYHKQGIELKTTKRRGYFTLFAIVLLQLNEAPSSVRQSEELILKSNG